MVEFADLSVAEAVEEAIKTATHLTTADFAAVAALRVLAVKMDALADSRAGVTEDGELTEDKKRGLDNVTAPTFLKYCSELGLTPAGRKALASKEGGTGAKPSGVRARRDRHLNAAS